ncbi:MAG TPA: major capsid protein [Mesotoga sp.]|nr:major capsid protein [Mesotoga sp.]
MAVSVNEFLKWFRKVDVADVWEATPYVPTFFGSLNIWTPPRGIVGYFHQAEMVKDKIQFIPTANRGAPGVTRSEPKRKRITFECPHMPVELRVTAEDLNNIDGGDAQSLANSAGGYLAEQFRRIRRDAQVTWELHRASMLRGVLLDVNGDTLHNYFTAFGVAEPTIVLANATLLKDIENIKRTVGNAMNGEMVEGIHIVCGTTLYATLRNHADVIANLDTDVNHAFQQKNLVWSQFSVKGITFVEARGAQGATPFMPNAEGRVVLSGTDYYEQLDASATGISNVGRPGKEVVFTEKILDHDEGIELRGQFNRLHIMKRPSLLFKVTYTA